MRKIDNIKMIPRSNGSFGIRNHLAVISTVACANIVAEAIASKVPGAVACTHPYGCDQIGEDAKLTKKTLTNIGRHPNVGSVLVTGLGCEEIVPDELAEQIAVVGKKVETLVIQEIGGSTRAVEKGIAVCEGLKKHMLGEERLIDAKLADLTIGLECGGSDYTSGIAANPAVGEGADLLIAAGAKVIFGETTELLGAEHIMAERAINKDVKTFILERVHRVEQAAKAMKVDIRGAQPSPGNIAGGLTTIEEKSLGAICKAGTSEIVSILEFGDIPRVAGLSFMDTPGNDLASICGLVAGGAQLILFTTGRGTPMGFAIAPVIKITANKQVAGKMSENIDIDLSGVLAGTMSITQAGKFILEMILDVAQGKLVAAEKLGHLEFGLHRIGPTL